MRSQIFCQIVQKFCRHTDVCQEISVLYDGKSASRLRAKPTGVPCAVLPYYYIKLWHISQYSFFINIIHTFVHFAQLLTNQVLGDIIFITNVKG